MTTKHLSLVSIVISVFLLMGNAYAQDELSSETLFLTFVPNVQFSPVYAAIDRGYFADAGFSLRIEHGDEPVGVDLIAVGERNFGIVSGEQLLAARGQGRPVVFVYEWFQRYPVGIVASRDSGIESVADLRGKRVGIPGRFGASYTGLTALLSANGMTERDINLQEIGFNAPEVMCIGAVDAAVVYVNNEPLQIANRAAAGDCGAVSSVQVFPVSDDADMVSNGIITNEMMLAEHPDRVADFVSAYDQGLRDVISNPAYAYLVSLDFVENLPIDEELRDALQSLNVAQSEWLSANPDADRVTMAERRQDMLTALQARFTGEQLIQFQVLLASINLWDADELGLAELASWQTTQEVLLDIGYMQTPLQDLSAAFTNAYVPDAGKE